MRTLCAAAALLALMQPAWVVPSLANSNHPLDALTEAEIRTVKQTLADAGYVTDDTRFPALTLAEPEKSTVLGWSPGDEVGRSAFVTLRQGPTTHEAIVDLDAGEVTAYREVEGVQSNILLEEWETALTSTTSSPEWQAAMGKRGYDTFDNLFCAPLSTGWFGDDQDKYEGARILKVPCFDTEGADNNLWARPIEGLYTVVDLISGEVIDVVDNKVVPVATEVPRYADGEIEGAREPLKPIEIAAPQGPNYERDGGVVEWQDWRFHVRVDRRVGPVLSLISFEDQGEARSIAYQITMAEMFVPYMDPSDEWYFRSYMDIGEYGFGLLASQLQPGIDCPDTATFINATLADDMGEPFEAAGIVCLFERNTGDPNWRHAELINQTYQGRPEVELVLRMIPTVGNYDYVIDYVFRQRGQLAVNVGATGIDATKGVETTHMSDETADEDTRYGELVAPNVVAVYHDHYISFRIDLDVDGTENSFVQSKVTPTEAPDSPRTSIWTLAEETVATEGPLEGHGPAIWRVTNPNKETRLGHHPSYQIEPGHGAVSVLDPEDYSQQRASFSAAPLWLTTYKPSEMFAAGDYPNQSKGGDGLPKFVDDEATENTDLVVWYTVGFHHVTRTEDWPVLPTKWHSFKLRPYNFFDQNPALDVPTKFRETAAAQ